MTGIRYPRQRFTKALERIASTLEIAHIRKVHHKDFRGKPCETVVQIKGLWVAGSYARGAPECGDLDLVLDAVGLDAGLPFLKDVVRGFFGANPRVAFYRGTPEDNSSGVVFSDARLIWSGEQPDWHTAIAAITMDPSAGHYARPSDNLPLTPEQMRGDISHVEPLIRDRDEGRLRWYHIDFLGDHRTQPLVPERVAKTLDRYTELGKATRHALSHFFAATDGHAWATEEFSRDWGRGPTEFRCGGTEIHAGAPRLPHNPLDVASTSRLVLVPYLTARGPNRAWVIERGPNHPLIQAADQRVAFVLANSGFPIETVTSDSGWGWEPFLELFSSRTAAQAHAARLNEADAEDNEGLEPAYVMELSGEELLECIARVRRLEILAEPFGDAEVIEMKNFSRFGADHSALFQDLMAKLPIRTNAK